MNVIVALDFSDVTQDVLDVVERISATAGMKLFLVHVAEPDPDFVGWQAGPDVVRKQVAEEFRREHRQLDDMARKLREAGREATALLVQGPIVETILDQASDLKAGLIVVGSHGHGAAYDLVVGSISSGVIRRAGVPVLVVPHAGRREEPGRRPAARP